LPLRLRIATSMTLLGLGACASATPAPSLGPTPREGDTTREANLLLFPQGDGEALLGRAVHVTEGGWTIADARTPGCEVKAVREAARFHSARKVSVGALASLSGGYAKLVSIEASFGRSNTASIDLDNTEVLRADMRGPCGDVVVDTVFVGHGKRVIEAAAEVAAKGDLQVGVVRAGPGVDSEKRLVDSIDWKDDQAYGFTFSRRAATPPLEVAVDLPSSVVEGDSVSIRFTSQRPAWLVVYSLSEGKAGVLWPSAEEPAPRVAPGAAAVLPSPREAMVGVRIAATLGARGVPSRETLVVYGFAEKADFDAMKPSAGGASDDGPQYVAELSRKLEAVPLGRWSRSLVSYVVEPKR
jgi:hypothetical protein